LDDVDNPSFTLVGAGPGEGALLVESAAEAREPSEPGEPREPRLSAPADFTPRMDTDEPDIDPPRQASADRTRQRNLPTVAPDPSPDGVRSRFDAADRVVYYNDQHEDYLIVKDEEPALLDYLATLVSKELVVYNNPRASPPELGEEMARMLVRVRRHMPRRRL
jgi:hypothetical protein